MAEDLCAEVPLRVSAAPTLAPVSAVAGKVVSLSSNLLNWGRAQASLGPGECLAQFHFDRNYSLLLKNVFGAPEASSSHYLGLLRRLLLRNLGPKLAAVCGASLDSERTLLETALLLFLLHLDVPALLLRSMAARTRLLLLGVVLHATFDVKELLVFAQTLPEAPFASDAFFDVGFEKPLSPALRRNLYFGFWYFRRVLRNFGQMLRGLQSDAPSSHSRAATDLLSFEEPSAQFPCERLSALVGGIDLNAAQQLFLFLKNKFNKNRRVSRRSYQRFTKTVWVPLGDGRTASLTLNSRVLNQNPFRCFHAKPALAGPALRKMKRHQEICIFVGPRLRNFISRRAAAGAAPVFTVSKGHFEQLRRKSPGSAPELSKVNRRLTRQIGTSYKIPVHLFKSMMCTDQFAEASQEFFSEAFLRGEVERLFARKLLPRKIDRFGPSFLLQLIFLPRFKVKLPWTVMELLNVIPYVSGLERSIDLAHLKA